MGQGFAVATPNSLLSLTLCDTQPSTPPGSAGTWEERKAVVGTKGLAALADGTMERWFTDEFKKVNPVRWREIRDTISGNTPAGGAVRAEEHHGAPPDRNQLIASKIPGGRYEGIAAARHLPNVERPDQFNRIMLSWLAANR